MQLEARTLLVLLGLLGFVGSANADTIRLSCDLKITSVREDGAWEVKEKVPLMIYRGKDGTYFDAKSRQLTIRVSSQQLESESVHLDNSTPEMWEIASAWEKPKPFQTLLRLDRVTGDFFYSYATFDNKSTVDAVGVCKRVTDTTKKF